eukprot:m.942810 g.942810  ORF g.942810 m.942810 type:complete len:70 (-) comp23838_c0_seq50:2750-2959(-)
MCALCVLCLLQPNFDVSCASDFVCRSLCVFYSVCVTELYIDVSHGSVVVVAPDSGPHPFVSIFLYHNAF